MNWVELMKYNAHHLTFQINKPFKGGTGWEVIMVL